MEKQSFLQKAGIYIEENPMKIYAGIFISGDVFLAMNVFYHASFLWFLGAMLGILAHVNKLKYGKGAPDIKGDDFKIGFEECLTVFMNTFKYAIGILAAKYWSELRTELGKGSLSAFSKKLKRSIKFKEYPLDIGWVLINIAGLLYLIDGLNIFGLREQMGFFEALLGFCVFTGSLVAFLTDRNDLAGRIMAIATLFTLLTGIFNLNLALLCASCVFLYGNYLVGKVDSQYQSNYMN